MKNYTKYLILLLILTVSQAYAQEEEEKKIKLDVSGFLKNDMVYDSRQNVEVLEGLLHLFPKDIN